MLFVQIPLTVLLRHATAAAAAAAAATAAAAAALQGCACCLNCAALVWPQGDRALDRILPRPYVAQWRDLEQQVGAWLVPHCILWGFGWQRCAADGCSICRATGCNLQQLAWRCNWVVELSALPRPVDLNATVPSLHHP